MNKIVSAKFSFEGWDWKKYIDSMEKPLIALLLPVGYLLEQKMYLEALSTLGIGIVAVSLYSAIKFYFNSYKE